MIALIFALIAVLFAALTYARARHGRLRLSELPVLLLALLAGSEERERLRLILSHRDRRRLSITTDEVGIRIAVVRPERSAIAAMERDIYGETFEHDGAPEASAPVAVLWSPTDPSAGPPPWHRKARCYCDFCRGRAGVHGAEATALYRAKVAAASRVTESEITVIAHGATARPAGCGICGYGTARVEGMCHACYQQERVHRSNLRWERPS